MICENNHCVHKKYPDGHACSEDDDCLHGLCELDTCNGRKVNGTECFSRFECQSKVCEFHQCGGAWYLDMLKNQTKKADELHPPPTKDVVKHNVSKTYDKYEKGHGEEDSDSGPSSTLILMAILVVFLFIIILLLLYLIRKNK